MDRRPTRPTVSIRVRARPTRSSRTPRTAAMAPTVPTVRSARTAAACTTAAARTWAATPMGKCAISSRAIRRRATSRLFQIQWLDVRRAPGSRPGLCRERRGAPGLLVPEQALRLFAEFRRDVGAGEGVGDVGGEEADLGAAVVALAVELQAVERLALGERDHRVGELDLAAGAARLRRQEVEDLRLQDIAAGDDEIRRRLRARRLLHHLGDAEQLALLLADADHAVHVHAVRR